MARPGTFQKGNKASVGNKGGRPTKEQARQKKLEQETADSIIKRNSAQLARRLVSDAMTEKGRRSLHVAINKLVPDAKVEQGEGSGTVQITFLQFTNDFTDRPAKAASVALKQPLPQENRLPEPQGQDGIKFLDFTKRRQ